MSQIKTPSRIKSCTFIQKIKEIKPHTVLAAISIIFLLSAAIATPSLNAYAEKDNGKGKINTNSNNNGKGHDNGKDNNHQKDRKDKDKDNDKDKKCKPKKNGKYNKDCD